MAVQLKEYTFRSISTGGRQRVRKVKAINFKRALDKALSLYTHIKYHLPYLTKQKMNLATAIKQAAKASVDTGVPYYVIADGDSKKGGCSINRAPLGNPIMKFRNGIEDKEFTERHAKPENNGKKSKPKKLSHEEFEALKFQNPKTITVMKNEETTPAKKEVAAKKAATPAKKVAAKKVAPAKKATASAKKEVSPKKEVKAKRAKYTDGKKVTMTNKEMTAKIKKGYQYFNEKGANKTRYIPERPNQDLVNKNYYEVAPN
jgi:hypothetical protein